MLNVRRAAKKRPMLDKVNKFLEEFTDLTYDGVKIMCLVCDKPLMCWDKCDCRKHINSAQHIHNKTGVNKKALFMFDLIFMLTACNLPFRILDNEAFRSFWSRYNPEWKLPSRTSLRNEVPAMREAVENRITAELQDKKLWLCVDQRTFSKKNSIVNVMVRTMEPLQRSDTFLLASKRLEQCTSKAVTKLVLNTLEKFQIPRNELLMVVTDGVATMQSVGELLKKECGNFLHITCKLNLLHVVVKEIRKCYPNVNDLISYTKAVFLKSPERIREFHRQCPNIPIPPQRILTRWGTWLKAAFYYVQHFQKIKSVVLQFDPKDTTAIKESQAKFQDPQVEADLQTIQQNYNILLEAIEILQNPLLSLEESLQIVDAVNAQLHAVNDPKNDSVVAKFDSVLKEDLDFRTLREIFNDYSPEDPLPYYADYFDYVHITTLDVERSFSSYKNIFSSRRSCFAETNIETYLMLQIFSQFHTSL